MSDRTYPNSGAMFTNDRKREGKRDPDRNGSIESTCPSCGAVTAWWINGWIKSSSRGQFLSLSLKQKHPPTDSNNQPAQQQDEGRVPF